MHKSILPLFLFAFSFAYNVSGCEICGCGNGNFQIGMLPNFNKGFFGARYSSQRFSSTLRADRTQFSHDNYKTFELWGGYNFKKLQLIAFMPYVMSRKQSDDGTTTSNGIGDLMILANYKILSVTSLSKNERTTVRHDLYIGGGIKLPTGVNKINPNGPDFNIGDFNSQAGTGSIDFIVNATHNFAWNNSGIVTNVAYRINTNNQQGYRFGNRMYFASSYYYTFTYSGIKIRPNAGINYQSNATNTFKGSAVEDSRGYNLNSTVGMNVMRNKVGFSAMAFIPVSQNLYDGQTRLLSRFMVGLTYSL